MNEPGLLTQILALVVPCMMAVMGYAGALIISNAKKLYGVEQSVRQWHADSIALHTDIIHRLNEAEKQVARLTALVNHL